MAEKVSPPPPLIFTKAFGTGVGSMGILPATPSSCGSTMMRRASYASYAFTTKNTTISSTATTTTRFVDGRNRPPPTTLQHPFQWSEEDEAAATAAATARVHNSTKILEERDVGRRQRRSIVGYRIITRVVAVVVYQHPSPLISLYCCETSQSKRM